MKVVVYGANKRVGAVSDGTVVDLNWAYAKYLREVKGVARPYVHADGTLPAGLAGFIERGRPALDAAHLALEYHADRNPEPVGARLERIVQPPGTRVHAPLPSPASAIAMAGGNYADHLRGFLSAKSGKEITLQQAYDETRRKGPWGFWKLPRTVIGPDEALVRPERAPYLDYEGEAAVILGRRGRDIPASRAHAYFWGYTLVNDWTIFGAGEQQRALSLNLAKNYDTACSIGPCIVVDEIEDPQTIDLQTRVNGELRQQGSTRDMVFSFAEFLAHLSRDLTMAPGDLISGGTPAGTAGDSSEYHDGVPSDKRFVHDGHEVEVSSPQIGALRNRVHRKERA